MFTLPCSSCVNYVAANRERSIIVAVTDTALFFYLADVIKLIICANELEIPFIQTRLLAFAYQRNAENLPEKHSFGRAFWKPDSSALCVTVFSLSMKI